MEEHPIDGFMFAKIFHDKKERLTIYVATEWLPKRQHKLSSGMSKLYCSRGKRSFSSSSSLRIKIQIKNLNGDVNL